MSPRRRSPSSLAVGFWKPHSHFNAPKKYWDLYDREKLPPVANPDPPVNVPGLALHDSRKSAARSRAGRRDARRRRTPKRCATATTPTPPTWTPRSGRSSPSSSAFDLRKNTIIVLWSDHGFHLGEHSLWAKTSVFELDARVPLIIATPEHRGGRRTKALVELLDLYPTLVDLCRLPAPTFDLEGESLRPILANPAATVKEGAFTWHPRPAYPAAGRKPEAMGYSVRSNRYRYTEWREFQTGKILARELYDHDKDPRESANVAGDGGLCRGGGADGGPLAGDSPARPDRALSVSLHCHPA